VSVIEDQRINLVDIERSWGRNAARLLKLLMEQGDHGVTVSEMRNEGIEAPAQEVYMLQVAGCEIERRPEPDRHGICTYRLRTSAGPCGPGEPSGDAFRGGKRARRPVRRLREI
jgi:hypothetical protein